MFDDIVFTNAHLNSDGTVTFERVQDCEDIVENNKRLQNEPQKLGAFHHIADIPNIMIEKFANEKGISYRELMQDFDSVIMRMLRDPDYMWLRTTSKRF